MCLLHERAHGELFRCPIFSVLLATFFKRSQGLVPQTVQQNGTNAILRDRSWVSSGLFEPAYVRGISRIKRVRGTSPLGCATFTGNLMCFLSYFKPSDEVTNAKCIPLHTTEERHLLFDDYFVIKKETIQSCQKETVTCQRLPRWVTFYPETEFSKSIDVGVCSGQCRDGPTCEPVWTKSKAIPTPHGELHHHISST